MFDRDEFTFYENGVVSLNLPIAKDVLGARATRTTHPKVIRGFEVLFSAVLERDITIRTPFQWLTKKEVTRKSSSTASATCSPRPAAAPARGPGPGTSGTAGPAPNASIGGSASWRPASAISILQSRYELDLLLGDRSLDRDVRMAVAYVKFFQNFASSSKSRFISDHPQSQRRSATFRTAGR